MDDDHINNIVSFMHTSDTLDSASDKKVKVKVIDLYSASS